MADYETVKCRDCKNEFSIEVNKDSNTIRLHYICSECKENYLEEVITEYEFKKLHEQNPELPKLEASDE